jgi:hypothetical protein
MARKAKDLIVGLFDPLLLSCIMINENMSTLQVVLGYVLLLLKVRLFRPLTLDLWLC